MRATRTSDRRDVIVKYLDPASEPILPRRFDRRSRTLTRLVDQRLGVLGVIDHGTAPDGRTYLVLPWLPLGSLQDQIDRGPTPWFPAARLMAKTAETVGRAADEGVVLGDIRPSKILLEGPASPIVSAFGMASRRFDDGRPTYRAPEASNDHAPTLASDVYSLALVFGALITGQARRTDEPIEAFLDRLVDIVPQRFLDVIEHGLAESPTNRHRSASAMHRALQRAVEAEPESQAWRRDSSVFDLGTYLSTAPDTPDPAVGPTGGSGEGPTADRVDLPTALVDELDDDRLLLPAGLDDIRMAEGPHDTTLLSEPSLDDLLDQLETAPAADATPAARLLESLDPDATADGDIVDLTELFTRTQDFHFDPDEFGGSDGSRGRGDEGATIGDEGSGPDGAETRTERQTTTLVREVEDASGDTDRPDQTDGSDEDATTHSSNGSHGPGASEADDPNGDPDPHDDLHDDLHDDEVTTVFPDVHPVPNEPDRSRPIAPAAAAGAHTGPFMADDRSTSIPFPNAGRVRPNDRDTGLVGSIRVRLELIWFQSRRSVATVAALLGLAAIVVLAVLFALREIRSTSTNQVRTEGAPAPLTTATSSADVSATHAPFVTDVAPTGEAGEPSSASSSRSATRPRTAPAAPTATTAIGTTTPPAEGGSASTEDPGDGAGISSTSTATTATPPTTAPRSTTTARQTTTEQPGQGQGRGRGRGNGDEDAAPASDEVLPSIGPALTGPTLLSVGSFTAAVTYGSSECVATRFRLAGSDGSSQSGASAGYDAQVECSTAWNLAFDGASGLLPQIDYSLTVTVKNAAGLTESGSLRFTTPA